MNIHSDLYTDLATILLEAIVDTDQYGANFESDWDSKPIPNARSAHRQAVVIARLRHHSTLSVDERYANGGQVRIRGLEPSATVLLKPRSSLLPPPADSPLSLPGLPPGGIPLLAYDIDDVVEFYRGTCRKIETNGRTQFQILDALTLTWSTPPADAFDQYAGDADPTDMPEHRLGRASTGTEL